MRHLRKTLGLKTYVFFFKVLVTTKTRKQTRIQLQNSTFSSINPTLCMCSIISMISPSSSLTRSPISLNYVFLLKSYKIVKICYMIVISIEKGLGSYIFHRGTRRIHHNLISHPPHHQAYPPPKFIFLSIKNTHFHPFFHPFHNRKDL